MKPQLVPFVEAGFTPTLAGKLFARGVESPDDLRNLSAYRRKKLNFGPKMMEKINMILDGQKPITQIRPRLPSASPIEEQLGQDMSTRRGTKMMSDVLPESFLEGAENCAMLIKENQGHEEYIHGLQDALKMMMNTTPEYVAGFNMFLTLPPSLRDKWIEKQV